MARQRVQVVLSLAPGAEAWVIVKHDQGWFKLPGHASALELLEGAQGRWGKHRTVRAANPVLVRVPLADYLAFCSWRGTLKGADSPT